MDYQAFLSLNSLISKELVTILRRVDLMGRRNHFIVAETFKIVFLIKQAKSEILDNWVICFKRKRLFSYWNYIISGKPWKCYVRLGIFKFWLILLSKVTNPIPWEAFLRFISTLSRVWYTLDSQKWTSNLRFLTFKTRVHILRTHLIFCMTHYGGCPWHSLIPLNMTFVSRTVLSLH